MRFYLIVFLLIILKAQSISQCPPSGVTIKSMADLENYTLQYGNCESIPGTVYITGDDIVNIDALIKVKEINGELFISSNPLLQNLDGLSNLHHIGGDVRIQNNPALTSLEGLSGLSTCLATYFYISACGLTNLEGLNNLDSLHGIFSIFNMPALVNLEGLDQLTFVGGDFSIYINEQLQNLTGLENLEEVQGGFQIRENPQIQSLQGLSETITLHSNLVIKDNPSLNICAVDPICNYLLDPPSFVFIANNAPGCNSEEEVNSQCISSSSHTDIPSIQLAPNFGQGIIRLPDTFTNTHVTVYNHVGSNILATKNALQIDLTHQPAGCYFVQVMMGGKSYYAKYIKY